MLLVGPDLGRRRKERVNDVARAYFNATSLVPACAEICENNRVSLEMKTHADNFEHRCMGQGQLLKLGNGITPNS